MGSSEQGNEGHIRAGYKSGRIVWDGTRCPGFRQLWAVAGAVAPFRLADVGAAPGQVPAYNMYLCTFVPPLTLTSDRFYRAPSVLMPGITIICLGW